MEAFNAENGDSNVQIAQIDFGKIINSIESQCQRSLLTRKNQLLQKQQQKQNWLTKTKIIPPTFPKFNQTDLSKNTLKPSSFYQNMFSDDGTKIIKNKNLASENSMQRHECKTSYGNVRNIASCNRIKTNWKLQFRKDELNILRYKYARSQQQENLEPQNSTKGFKIRKVFKKIQEITSDPYSNYKNFIDITDAKFNNYRQRLKTAQIQEPNRRKYFAE